MAHTRFTLEVDNVLSDAQQLEIITALEPVAAAHGLKRSVDVRKPKLTVKIRPDEDASNPRVEWDNIGVMYCKHSRYDLGDKDADSPVIEEQGKEIDGRWLNEDEIAYVEDMLDSMIYEYNDDVEEESDLGCWGLWTAEGVAEVLRQIEHAEWEERSRVRDDIAIILPLYLYDHSGLTMSHGSFSCQWDSGQVGWHYITKDAFEENWKDLDSARRCLEAELGTYDDYLRGNVWFFEVLDEDGDTVDSCSGFYGDELEETGILDHLDNDLHEQAKEAWDERF